MDINRTANAYGTPFYYFDGTVLKDRIEYLKNRLPANVDLCYAVKANTFLIGEAEPWVSRLEICSPGEAEICLGLQVLEEKMVISGVYKTPEFIEKLVRDHPQIGIYTAESPAQYELLEALANKYERKLKVLLRISSGNQFGIDRQEAEILLEKDSPALDIRGIQYFSGTQKTSLKKMARELRVCEEIIEAHPWISELEFGPGFPVYYFEGEDFDEEAYLAAFSEQILPFAQKVHVTLELGRSIAASCGTYVTSVVDRKQTGKERFAIVDGGIHQMAYYGQFMAMKLPFMEVLSPEGKARGRETEEVWNICGSLCTINDILVKQLPAEGLSVGDRLVFKNTGAYSVTEGIALFLSRDLPAVIIKAAQSEEELLARPHQELYPINWKGKE